MILLAQPHSSSPPPKPTYYMLLKKIPQKLCFFSLTPLFPKQQHNALKYFPQKLCFCSLTPHPAFPHPKNYILYVYQETSPEAFLFLDHPAFFPKLCTYYRLSKFFPELFFRARSHRFFPKTMYRLYVLKRFPRTFILLAHPALFPKPTYYTFSRKFPELSFRLLTPTPLLFPKNYVHIMRSQEISQNFCFCSLTPLFSENNLCFSRNFPRKFISLAHGAFFTKPTYCTSKFSRHFPERFFCARSPRLW